MVWIAHLAFAALLFELINWVGRHSTGFGYIQLSVFVRPDEAPAFNFLLRVLGPTVYIIICSTVLYAASADQFVRDIWIVVPLSFLIRIVFSVTLGRFGLLSVTAILVQLTAATFLAYLAYVHLIVPRTPLFPDLTAVGNELWIAVAFFLYVVSNNVRMETSRTSKRKKKYLAKTANRFRGCYEASIVGKFDRPILEALVYAILVIENFNRPFVRRQIEAFWPGKGPRTLGVMQVTSPRPISDAESIVLGVNLIRQYSKEVEAEHPNANAYFFVERIVAKYNRDQAYVSEVMEVMEDLCIQVMTEYRVSYETIRDERFRVVGPWSDEDVLAI